MIQIVTSVVISLLLTTILLRAHEIKMKERFSDIYEKLLRICRIIGEADLGKNSPESGHDSC